jgi:magnesium and cobalt transporter
VSERKPRARAKASAGWVRKLAQLMSGEAQDREDLIQQLRDARERGLIDGEALNMLEGVLGVSDIQVRDIMVPRAQMVCVRRQDTPEELMPVVVESGHSRFPVLDADRDDVIGILLAKDLLRTIGTSDAARFDIREFMRPAVVVPESKRVNVLLKDFRRNRNHMAIVVDEYGGVAGLVTIEDAIEQIVGEIDDEFDIDDEQNIRKDGERQYAVRGAPPIEEFSDYFGVSYEADGFDTVAGLIIRHLGRLPRRGESVQLGDLEFRIARADRRRVDTLRVVANRDIVPPEEREAAG